MNLERTLKELERLKQKCSEQNWDGYSAEPISNESYQMAVKFLQLLPEEISSPEITIDPDGDVSLEWYAMKQSFLISISVNKILYYAGISKQGKYNDKADFSEDCIPDKILERLTEFQ